MEDLQQDTNHHHHHLHHLHNNHSNIQNSGSNQPSAERNNAEPVRSRWTPKPEQILILESIFNSGMVNPPKDETVRIRKLLERFGAVGDANVFYWFQNRRSRSRRRQRQIQAGLAGDPGAAQPLQGPVPGPVRFNSGFNSGGVFFPPMTTLGSQSCSLVSGGGSSSSGGGAEGIDDVFAVSSQMGVPEMHQNSIFCPSDASSLHYHQAPGLVTVFINGVATEVPRGPLDMKGMFGQDHDVLLVHSSGVPLPVNEFGFSTHSLHHGESYFLVPRAS